MTETTLFMRIQNIKNGAQYTDGSFHYSLFFSPQPASATQLPTECICSNTINVTFADCLLAFYLNGNSALAAAVCRSAAARRPRAPGAVSSGSRPGGCRTSHPSCGGAGACAAGRTHLRVNGRAGMVAESRPREDAAW